MFVFLCMTALVAGASPLDGLSPLESVRAPPAGCGPDRQLSLQAGFEWAQRRGESSRTVWAVGVVLSYRPGGPACPPPPTSDGRIERCRALLTPVSGALAQAEHRARWRVLGCGRDAVAPTEGRP